MADLACLFRMRDEEEKDVVKEVVCHEQPDDANRHPQKYRSGIQDWLPCTLDAAPVGASYQLPRPLQLEHVIDPEPPHGEQGTVLVEEEAAPCGKPLVGPEGAALKRRRTIHATGFSPKAFASVKIQPTTVHPSKRLSTNICPMEPKTGFRGRFRNHAIRVGAK